ncbi:hypothetical protein H6F77_08465 [Microcoleus sp. FACHB-831]|nr:hypothetical protein [Microcoleus sp. FACHB-831]
MNRQDAKDAKLREEKEGDLLRSARGVTRVDEAVQKTFHLASAFSVGYACQDQHIFRLCGFPLQLGNFVKGGQINE